MVDENVIALSHGLWREGVQHREAALRPLDGAGEARLAELAPAASPAERATCLLAAATRRIGVLEPISPDDLRALTVGDRERLLLALYRLAFGRRIEAVARCVAERCGAALELDLDVDELLAPPQELDGGPEHRLDVDLDGGVAWQVRFRLPTGGDQAAAARLASSDPAAAADLILRRSVVGLTGTEGRPVELDDDALELLRRPLAEAFARLDPLAEIALELSCPECGAATATLLDAASFLLAELERGDGIWAEVDRLARVYHWSEAEILALPLARRRRYLALARGAA